jgi:hypothetical protein
LPVIEVTFSALPKQKDFLRSQAPELLYSGGFGGGKTLALCMKAVCRAAHPLAREFLGRLTLDDFKATTLKTLLDGDGQTPPVLPYGSYVHNKAERTIKLKGAGEIVYGGFADRSADPSRMKAGSRNLSGVGADQAEELNEDIWQKWSGRPRATGEGLTRQVYGVCNPAAPSHFLARRFGITGDLTEKVEGTQFILTNPFENPFLPTDYLARLRTLKGVLYKRMVLGLWVASEGVVFDRWNRDRHMKQREGPWVRTLVGLDDGYHDPFVALLAHFDADGRCHIRREVYRDSMSESEKVEAVREWGSVERIIPDPSAAGIAGALRRAGFTVTPGKNDVITGINEVQNWLDTSAPDGEPMLTVDPECRKLIVCLESQEWLDNRKKDTPNHNFSHGNDALRYLLMHERKPAAAAFDQPTLRLIRGTTKPALYRGDLVSRIGWDLELDLELRKHKAACCRWNEDEGSWRLWCELEEDQKGKLRPSPDRNYVVAVSVGTGLPGSPSVIKVGDAELREVVAEAVLEDTTPETAARVAIMAGLWFEGPGGRARLIWKHEGPGVPFGETVRRLGYGRVYQHHTEGTPTGDPGWQWTKEGIHALFGELRNAVAARRYIERAAETVRDCERWVFHPNGTLGPATLDAEGTTIKEATDRAMAAMLLAHAFAWCHSNPIPKHKPQPGSVLWQEERERAGKKRAVLGKRR